LATAIRERIGAKSAAETILHFNFMVYGEFGVGKTRLLGTAQDHPLTSPVLVLDIEAGSATLRDRPDVDVVRVDSMKKLVDQYKELEEDAQSGKPYYKTVGIDSLTELQKLDMNDIMKAVIKRDSDRDPDVPSMREWGKSTNHIRQIVRQFRDLPYNVIFTALLARDQDESSGAVSYGPDLPGKLKGQIPGFLDVVGYMHTIQEKDAIERRLLVQPTQKYKAKDRLGVSSDGPVIIDPTIPKMFNSIIGTGKSPSVTKGK